MIIYISLFLRTSFSTHIFMGTYKLVTLIPKLTEQKKCNTIKLVKH